MRSKDATRKSESGDGHGPTRPRRFLLDWHRPHCIFSILLLSVVCWQVDALAADPPVSPPLEMRPYRVRLLVACDSSHWPAVTRQDFLIETRRTASRCVGSMWQLEAEAIDWLQPASAERLSRVTPFELTERVADPKDAIDVWFVATIESARPGWKIDVRSWQPEFEVATEVSTSVVMDPREVPLAIVKLCHGAFRPVGIVDEVDGDSVRVVLQAGALPAPDAAFALTQPGDTLASWLAYRNREGRIERMQQIPWTYLTVGEAGTTRICCELSSGLRSPISGKKRGRIETLAIVVRPVHSVSRVELATQTKPSLPLVAHRILIRDSSDIPRADAAEQVGDHLLDTRLTDRRGQVSIPADGTRPLLWLFAYSGRHLLARVPFVPGSVSYARLEVPDDAARLEAESNLQLLQGQLIDAVAAQTTAFAAIRAAIKRNDLQRAAAEELKLRKLPDAQVFLERLTGIRVPAVKAARSRRDRVGEVRINRMCDEMSELIRQYLNEDKRQQIREELKELKQEHAVVEEESRSP